MDNGVPLKTQETLQFVRLTGGSLTLTMLLENAGNSFPGKIKRRVKWEVQEMIT